MWKQSPSWQAVSAHRHRVPVAGSEGPRLVNSTLMLRYQAISGGCSSIYHSEEEYCGD
ncbi:unnamed protein product [Arabidopsis halleri]